MNKFDIIIFERLYERPCWAKTFYRLKTRLTALVAAGYIERIPPPGSINTAQNMLKLTDKGIARIERHWRVQKRKMDMVELAERMAEHDEPPKVAADKIGISKARAQRAFDEMVLELGVQAA